MYLSINCNLSTSIHLFIFPLVILDMYFYLVNKDIIIIIFINYLYRLIAAEILVCNTTQSGFQALV